MLVVLLISIMAPQEALVYPLYYMAKQVGLFDSMLSVILIFGVLHTAFGTYLLSSVLTTFPREIIEAAQIDNASRWQILWMVIVPILRPTLAVLATFFFIWTWNEFLILWFSWSPTITRRSPSPWACCRAPIRRIQPRLRRRLCSALHRR